MPMHRTQLLIPPELHRRAAEAARARRLSLGSLVREALTDYLARGGDARPRDDAVDEKLLADQQPCCWLPESLHPEITRSGPSG